MIFTFVDRLTGRVGSGHDFRGSGPENGFVCNSEDTTGSIKLRLSVYNVQLKSR